MLKYKYTCNDVSYALSKYTCLVHVPLPDGTVYNDDNQSTQLKSISLAIVTEENRENKYRVPVDGYAEVFGISNSCELRTPDDHVYGLGVLTKDQLNHIVDVATDVTVLTKWSGLDLDTDPKLTAVPDGYDWKHIVDTLEKVGKVKVRYTEHEYRDDVRDIIWVQDYQLPYRISVDALTSGCKAFCDHLIKLFEDEVKL